MNFNTPNHRLAVDAFRERPGRGGAARRLGWRVRWIGWLVVAASGLHAAEAPKAPGSYTPEDALQAYRRGRFGDSQKEYATLAQENPDDARLRFNAGAAAYRQNDLTNAARWFESVTAAPDLKLQQQAYYNLGNTRYRLGEAVQDPKDRQRLWQEALTNFTAASKLGTGDTNALGNLAFVRRKLEELARQQPPPPQQPQDQDSNKDDQDPKDKDNSKDSPRSKEGKSRKSDDDQQKNSSNENPDSSGKDPGKDSGKESKGKDSGDNASSASNPDSEKSEADSREPSEKNSGEGDSREGKEAAGKRGEQNAAEEGHGEGAAQRAEGDPKNGEMTAAQAARLLEGQKGDEKALMLRSPGGKNPAERASRVRKPW
ncbi:MAG: hypothetical protein JNL10_08890 [Verrucomicrobiales bacterium]|nr:hypothetical protein [Verrucomicrobiales bacterium]